LPTRTDEAETSAVRARAEANFKKEERAREGAQAMLEYQANGKEVRENMAKLKALRLAKEAADQAEAVAKPAQPKSPASKSPAKTTTKDASKETVKKVRKR
jgi:hypothetical protein